jgi:hypothetical protein
MDFINTSICKLYELTKRSHYVCEDKWYNCPKSSGGSHNDALGDECNCGADEHNAEVDEIMKSISKFNRDNY